MHGKQTYAYDALGNLESDTSPMGEVNTYVYDSLGRVTEILEAGNLTEETDPNGNKTSYEYDALDRLISITEADGSRNRGIPGSREGKERKPHHPVHL